MHLFVPCPHLDDEVVEAPPEVHGLSHRGGDRGVQVRHGQERRGAWSRLYYYLDLVDNLICVSTSQE